MEDDTIYKTLLEIKGSTDAANALLTAHVAAFDKHVEEDAKLSNRITALEASQQRQRGFIAGVMAICTAIGSSTALFITWLARGH